MHGLEVVFQHLFCLALGVYFSLLKVLVYLVHLAFEFLDQLLAVQVSGVVSFA